VIGFVLTALQREKRDMERGRIESEKETEIVAEAGIKEGGM
jgi:hypothetical protein